MRHGSTVCFGMQLASAFCLQLLKWECCRNQLHVTDKLPLTVRPGQGKGIKLRPGYSCLTACQL
jgi:hypothetical protein